MLRGCTAYHDPWTMKKASLESAQSPSSVFNGRATMFPREIRVLYTSSYLPGLIRHLISLHVKYVRSWACLVLGNWDTAIEWRYII